MKVTMKYSKNLEAKLQEKVGEPRKEELQQPEEAEPSSPRLLSDKDPRKTGVFQKTPEEECEQTWRYWRTYDVASNIN